MSHHPSLTIPEVSAKYKEVYNLGGNIKKLLEADGNYKVNVSIGEDYQSYGLRINSNDGNIYIGVLWLINQRLNAGLDSLVLESSQSKTVESKLIVSEVKRTLDREVRLFVRDKVTNKTII